MKIIGTDSVNRHVIVTMTEDEWDELGRAAEIPNDKRNKATGSTLSIEVLKQRNVALYELKTMRKDLMAVQKKWDALAVRLDAALEK